MAHWLFEAPEEYLLPAPHDTQDLPSSDDDLPAAHGVLDLVPSQLNPAVHLVHAVFVDAEPLVKLPGAHVSHASFDAPEEYVLPMPHRVQDVRYVVERVPAAQFLHSDILASSWKVPATHCVFTPPGHAYPAEHQ